jgi:hypothetical protein
MSPNLTDAMRDWLHEPNRRRELLSCVMADFGRTFRLSPEKLSSVLAEFIREEYAALRPGGRRLDS